MSKFTATAENVVNAPTHRALWENMARLLEYPGADHALRLTQASLQMAHSGSAAVESWGRFYSAVERLSVDEREELYTATFDIGPACVPYVGIHLFGEENFQRGQFMAALLERYASCGFETGTELPDHIAVLLRYAAQTDESEQRDLVQYCLLGPLRRMYESLSEEHPYRALLEAVKIMVQETHPGVVAAPCPVSAPAEKGQVRCSCPSSFLTGNAGAVCGMEEDL